jgi:DNA-binding CsgD family transcriptional regulator/tetratricopeptide (TPR) repeat protein
VVETSFDLSLIDEISGLPGPRLLDAMEEAETACLIERLNGSMRYRFRLPVVRRGVYELLPRVRRDSLHWRAGCALRTRFGREPRRLPEIAHHLFEGISVGDPAEVATWSELAGDRAFQLTDFDEAVRWYQLALEALDSLPDRNALERGRVLLAIGRAHMASGSFDQARIELNNALSESRSTGDAAMLARVALAFKPNGMLPGRPDPQHLALLTDALESLPEEDEDLRVQVLTQLSASSLLDNHLEQAKAFADEAEAIAQHLPDVASLTMALSARRDSALYSADAAEIGVGCNDILRAAESAGDSLSLIEARRQIIVERFELAEVPAVERELQAYASLAISLRQPSFGWRLALWRAALSAISGDFDRAEQQSSEAYWLGKRLSSDQADAAFAVQRAMIALTRHNLVELVPMLEEMAEAPLRDPWAQVWHAFLARAYFESQQVDRASRELTRLLALDLGNLAPPSMLLPTLVAVVPPLIALANTAEHERFLLLLRRHEGKAVIAFDGIAWFGAVSHYIGLLETAAGRKDAALLSHESAFELAQRARSGPWIIFSSVALARSLKDRGRSADAERARVLLSEARSIAESLGMQGEMAGIEGQLGQGSRASCASPPAPFGLSEREIEVLRLLAAGRSSREIAEQLVISTRTAEHHVQNIYNKTGARRRVDAAALAGRHGLLAVD